MKNLQTEELKDLLLQGLNRYEVLGNIFTWEELNQEYKARLNQ